MILARWKNVWILLLADQTLLLCDLLYFRGVCRLYPSTDLGKLLLSHLGLVWVLTIYSRRTRISILLLPFQSLLFFLFPPDFLLFKSYLLILLKISPSVPQTPQDNINAEQVLAASGNEFNWTTITWNPLLKTSLSLILFVTNTLETKETKNHAKPNTNDGYDDTSCYFRWGLIWWFSVTWRRIGDNLFIDMVGVVDDISEGFHLLMRA